MKISICLPVRRFGGVLRQIEFFKYQTFPKNDFELVIIDGLHWMREKDVRLKAKEYGLNLKYAVPTKRNRKILADHQQLRNDALVLADGELIVNFDDYQIPDIHLLEEHWKVYQQGYCCQGRQYYFEKLNFDNLKSGETLPLTKSNNLDLGNISKEVSPTTFYTHNCSAPLKRFVEINGFDERYASGTGGEDYDSGARLGRLGCKFMYNPNAICYHMQHSGILLYPANPDTCSYICNAKTKEKFLEKYPTMKADIDSIDWNNIGKYRGKNHDRSPIYKHPNFTGNFSTETLETWNDNGLIFFRCKICGVEGIIDSIPLFHWNTQHKIIEAPKEYFDLNLERQKIAQKD